MAHLRLRQMLLFFVAASNLEGGDAFYFRGFDLADDVIVHMKDGDGKASAPFIPESGHSTLDGNGSRPFGVRSHDPRFGFDDTRGAAAAAVLSEFIIHT